MILGLPFDPRRHAGPLAALALGALVLFAPHPQPPDASLLSRRYEAPSLASPFGRDRLGRDLFSRTLFAAQLSLGNALKAATLSLGLAAALGALAGFFENRLPDILLNWIAITLQSLPFFLLIVAIAGALQLRPTLIPWLIGAVLWAPPARLVRNQCALLRRATFVRAQLAHGVPTPRILSHCLIPLALQPALVSVLLLLPDMLAIDAALSFFGLGFPPPTPAFGSLILDGFREVNAGWWLALMPVMCLVFLVAGLRITVSRMNLTQDESD